MIQRSLTSEERARLAVYRDRWMARQFSTAPADRAEAEAGVREVYRTAGLPEPKHVLWFHSPLAGAMAAGLLRGVRPSGDHAAVEQAIRKQLGDVTMAGALHGRPTPAQGHAPLIGGIFRAAYAHEAIFTIETQELVQKVVSATSACFHNSPSILEAQVSRAAGPAVAALLADSIPAVFSFGMLADSDFHAEVLGDPNAAAHRGLIRVAQQSALWWAFDHAAVLVDHPTELHRDADGKLHNERGPALACRDGWEIYAWHRTVVPREWIVDPQTITLETIRRQKYPYQDILIEIFGRDRYRRELRAAKKSAPPPSKLLKQSLPADPEERSSLLRAHTPALPLFDRYLAGECEPVWAELAALGERVRSDPHTADALAVAYETMTRARRNVEILVERLRRRRYKFRTARPHVAPGPKTPKHIARLDRDAGPLPLALRVWFEVVGAVDFTGVHPALAAPSAEFASDPLVVFPVHELLDEYQSWKADAESDDAYLLPLSPDELHKANTSGGDPYEIQLPCPLADAPLLNERHATTFVHYLRISFQHGGFAGFDGSPHPPELGALTEGLSPL